MPSSLQYRGVFEELLQGWDGEEAVIRYDAESGAWIFVCIHSTALGARGRRHADAGLPHSGRRSRRRDAPVARR